MNTSTIRFACVVACVVALPSFAQAAADIDFREYRLRHVCQDGETPGAVCCAPTECGTGTCVIDSIGKASGQLTLVVDDDVSELDGDVVVGRRLRALTVILETKGKSGVALAQTFQRLDDSSLANLLTSLEAGPADEFGFAVTEDLLSQFVDPTTTGIPLDISWLIYRTLDPETVARMRAAAGLPAGGPEILVVQPTKLKLSRYADASGVADPFASLLRVKLNAYFVAPKPPQC